MTGNPDRLGVLDESFLIAEGPNAPLHVASVALFEPDGLCDEHGLRLEAIRARIAARLGLLPRLRQRIAHVPLGLARPVWVDDERFDIANHVDAVELGGTRDEAALLQLAEELLMSPLDHDRPLWHLRFVTGLADGRVAVIQRTHHALVDGVSGVDVSLVLLDTEPNPPDAPPPDWTATPAPAPSALVASGLTDRVSATVGAAMRGASRLAHPRNLAHVAADLGRTIGELRKAGLVAAPTSLNGPVGPSRQLSLIRARLEEVRRAGSAHGATVNDVVLTAVAGGLRQLFLARGEPLPTDRVIKVLVPVSVRSDDQAMALGNRVGSLLAALPIGIGDPLARLRAVATTTSALKRSSEAATVDVALQAADLLPPVVAHALQRSLNHQPLANLIVTNVPGPPFPLYALGSRMLEAFPVVPLGANLTLEVAVLSYDGALNLGISSDRQACPDVDVFVRGVEEALRDLHVTWTPDTDRVPAAVDVTFGPAAGPGKGGG